MMNSKLVSEVTPQTGDFAKAPLNPASNNNEKLDADRKSPTSTQVAMPMNPDPTQTVTIVNLNKHTPLRVSKIVKGPSNNSILNQVIPNAQFQATSYFQIAKHNYYYRKINSAVPIERTSLIGMKEFDLIEFDDYFEKHSDKFLSPEIDEIIIYFTADYLVGLQFTYRDMWGRDDREKYNGKSHVSKSACFNNYQSASLTLDFDDFIKEIYSEGYDYVAYLKIVSYKGRTIECGTASQKSLNNLIPEFRKCIGVGGSYDLCISNLYFYYI